jgi:hypothetical protein
MKAFYCDHFVLPLPPTHSFPMLKYRKLRERVIADGILDPGDLVEPRAVALDELLLAHDATYVADVIEGRLTSEQQRRIGFPWSAAMVERSRRSVGGTIAAARLALTDGAAVNLAGGTHHAFRDLAPATVSSTMSPSPRASSNGMRSHRVRHRRGAVIDCDVHQGDGTAAIFRATLPSSLSFMAGRTLQEGERPPHHAAGWRAGMTISGSWLWPEEAFGGSSGSGVLAGADPYGDRLGRLKLTVEGLGAGSSRDRTLRGIPIAACRRRLPPDIDDRRDPCQHVREVVCRCCPRLTSGPCLACRT